MDYLGFILANSSGYSQDAQEELDPYPFSRAYQKIKSTFSSSELLQVATLTTLCALSALSHLD